MSNKQTSHGVLVSCDRATCVMSCVAGAAGLSLQSQILTTIFLVIRLYCRCVLPQQYNMVLLPQQYSNTVSCH